MIDAAIQLALRAHLNTLSVVTTGSVTLSATATGYARSSGSFIDDGFAEGLELDASGFTKSANNGAHVVTAVTATELTVDGATSAESAASGRTLAVGVPSRVAWEGDDFTREPGWPHFEEQYIPGPTPQITLGPLGQLELTPQYQVQVHVPENTGSLGGRRYTDALKKHFAPRTAIAVGSDTLRVRADGGPFGDQFVRRVPGWMVAPLTFPLRIRTANTI